MKLQPNETELVGNWVVKDGRVVGDAVDERIAWLISHHLRKCAVGNWEILFQDPDDGRYWEETFPHSHWHGGGPPALKCISSEEAKVKYGI